jgi:DNA-binding transcriptional LysR family regulator
MRINRPSLVEMECFVAVAEELNFSKAAVRLHISQPPLSRHIQSLEEKLGVRLLVRNTRRVELEAAGRMFLEDARRVLGQVDAASEAVRRARGGEPRRLRLAFVGALVDEVMVGRLQAFRQARPECQLHLRDEPPSTQLDLLHQGEVDGAFLGVAPKKSSSKFLVKIWRREPLLIALPSGHALSKARELRLSQVAGEPWILVARQAAPGFRAFVDDFRKSQKFEPRVVGESGRMAAVLTMVAANQGLSLVPSSVSRMMSSGVVFRPLAGKGLPDLAHSFLYPKASKNADLAALIRVLTHAR